MTLLLLFFSHFTNIKTQIYSLNLSITFAELRSNFPHRCPEPRFELGAAQRATNWATTLPTELRRTLLSYVAPYWATPHPAEIRRTLQIMY